MKLKNTLSKAVVSAVAFFLFANLSFGQLKKFKGTWLSEETTVKYDITVKGGEISIKAIDQRDEEVLQVSNIHPHPEGTTVDISLYTPSTDYRVECELILIKRGKIKEVIYHDESIFEVYYKKEKKKITAE